MNMNKSRKLLFIAGIPGVGKTTIGNFLEQKYGYIHIDMERKNRNVSKIMNDHEKFISTFFSDDSHIVVTWGFSPDQRTIDFIKKLQKYGFDVFWFTGSQNSTRKACMSRPDFDEANLQRQMKLLDEWDIPSKINVNIVNVFDAKGSFKDVIYIAKEIGAI